MASIPQQLKSAEPRAMESLPRGSVVISGVSGTFPNSENVMELSDILYKKINPITSDNPRWQNFHPDVPEYLGQVPNLDSFDAQFFKVHFWLGKNMDSLARKLLEHTYQAIYDAGLNPAHLSGKRIGVWIGTSLSETEKAFFYSSVYRNGFGISGCNKAMFANRISYWLNLKGPSMALDGSCASSMIALERAYEAIRSGECEAAIVGGGNISLHPHASLHFARLNPLSKDGKTKSFCKNADGFVRSESINVLFLQRSEDAKRIHARVCHVSSQFGPQIRDSVQRYGAFRDPEKLTKFFRDFYHTAGIHPHKVEYVEAFGSASPEADKSELEAIENVFCFRREAPLYVGSIMSNIGYCEAASGTASIIKVLLGYHSGEVAANLHCEDLRDDVTALREGRMRIVTEHQPLQRSYAAINTFAITGLNVHVLLQGFNKEKDASRYHSEIPRLVLISGRQESAVHRILKDLKSRPIDPEEIGLLHHIHEMKISGHLGRGYIVLGSNEENQTISLVEKSDYCDEAQKPLWFVYSGMGSQWAGMGAQLMRIPVFAAAIERCRVALEPKGINIFHIITSTEKTIFDNILHSFVGIAAVQIGLTDVLRELGMVPDKIIGHSVGELGCAYADGCFTAEEMILAAYSRGLVSMQTPFIHGAMAAVGLGYEQMVTMCPPEIEVACHNGPESSTISGPSDSMREFVAKLTAQGIFAKEVPCSNIAFHSRYIQDAGPGLLKYLKEVIKSPKTRSDRWLSTSVAQDKWDEPLAKLSSAEYHTNNLLNPVLFEETSTLVPANAVLIEVAPHGLLQAILKRSLPASCIHVPLTRRGHADNALFLLEAVGKLYMQGYDPKIRSLYQDIVYPVSTGTPFLSHLVEWAHEEKWGVPRYLTGHSRVALANKYIISTHDDEHSYLRGNLRGSKMLYPFSGALACVWDTLAMSMCAMRGEVSVQFHNVHVHLEPRLSDDELLRLDVQIQKGNGYFEVMDGTIKIASGYVFAEKKHTDVVFTLPSTVLDVADTILSSQDVYKLYYERGSYYKGEFRSIKILNEELTRAQIVWSDNWVTLLESVIQLNALRRDHNGVSQVKFIRRIFINMNEHVKAKQNLKANNNCFESNVFIIHGATRCGGVVMKDIKFRDLPKVCDCLPSNLQLNCIMGPPEEKEILTNQKLKRSSTVTLRRTKVGDLNFLHWEEYARLESNVMQIKVHYAGLNVCDAKRATGTTLNITNDNGEEIGYGMDFSGVSSRGERVMGVIRGGAASSLVAAEPALLWPVPEHWSLEDAATVPLPYAHAFYCLAIKSNLTHGMSVLVHSATGAFGQAAISIALAYGCQVFATVSTMKKKHFLRKIFPSIPDDHIGNSRDSSFVDMVQNKTNGSGCELALSCVEGNLLNLTFDCLGVSGILVDVSQLSNYPNYEFGMSYLTKYRNYISADFSSIFTQSTTDMHKLQLMLSDGIAQGYVRPLTRVVYEPEDHVRAFNLLRNSQHRGRVLLRMIGKNIHNAISRVTLNPDRCHLVVAAVSEDILVSQIVDRLIARGAKNIVLYCQQYTEYTSDGYMKVKTKKWSDIGIRIKLFKEISESPRDIDNLIKYCNSLGPLEALYVLATGNTDERTCSKLATIVIKLDMITRKCPSLKYFVIINENKIVSDFCKIRMKDGVPSLMLCLPKLAKSYDETNNYGDDNARDVITYSSVVEALELALQLPSGIYSVKLSSNSEELIKSESKITDLRLLFNIVNPDEMFGETEMIFMPTITNRVEVQDELINDDSYLILVPGLEGHYSKFKSLCERLKITGVVLQPGTDKPYETISEIAARLAEVIMKNLKPRPRFQLLGYSFGVLIALEIAAVLEEHGLEGVVFCVDGSPDTFPSALESWLSQAGATDEPRLQDALVQHMYTLMTGSSSQPLQLASKLLEAHSWRDKVEECVCALRGRVTHSAQYARALIETAYARIEKARRYDAERLRARPLRSQLVVLRAGGDGGSQEGSGSVETDLGLSRYSQRAPLVYTLEADHAHALQDLRCANIVNRHLDPAIHEAFLKRNLCESYLLNSSMFECENIVLN